MNKYIKIWNRKVWLDYPPLVIVEIWINHNGDLNTAFKMVDAAYLSWAEIIKHQTHIIDDEMSKEAKKVIPWNSNISIYEIMKKCALSEKDEIKLKEYVESKWMIFISTPFSRAAANRLEKMWVVAYKIWSWECNNYPLIEHIAKFWKPMIVSTWMNDIESIKKTVSILDKYNIDYALLHTTNLYPTPPHLVRLWAMLELQKEFPHSIIWLSDHTINNYACFWAVSLWASILERHFTDRKDRTWPDIINSMDPVELKELIIWSSDIAKMRWWKKEAAREEQVSINFAFATVVTLKDIKKWEEFTEENIWVKRPWTWEIKAVFYNQILWKKSLKDIKKDTHLQFNDVQWLKK